MNIIECRLRTINQSKRDLMKLCLTSIFFFTAILATSVHSASLQTQIKEAEHSLEAKKERDMNECRRSGGNYKARSACVERVNKQFLYDREHIEKDPQSYIASRNNRRGSNGSQRNDVGACMGDCASEQGICISHCSGDGRCIANCSSAHGRCVSRCH